MKNNKINMIASDYATYGEDVFIHDTAIIKHPHLVEIGDHIAIDNGVTISTGMRMGDYIHIAPYVIIIGGNTTTLKLHDFSFIASGTKIVMGSENYTGGGLVGPTIPKEYRELIFEDVTFERFAGCGVNCTIMPGITLLILLIAMAVFSIATLLQYGREGKANE